MSASSVFGDVTKTFVELLKREQLPPDSFDITVKPPGEEIESSSKPKLNLYLFRIDENDFAQNRDWQPVGTEAKRYPPLALNLFYVFTPYANEEEAGQRALGETMRIMYEHTIISAPYLQGTLAYDADELKVDLCKFNLEELTRIWNAFNQPYRLSVCYQVRIVYIDAAIEQKVSRVKEKENRHL